MPLYKISDFYSNYQHEIFGGDDVKGLDIYTEHDQKVGTVSDILVDQDGRFRYLVIDTGFWIFGKQVLLPAGLFRSDPRQQRIYLRGLSKRQAEDLPEYHESMTVDYEYEEQVRQVYRVAPLEASAPLEAGSPLVSATLTPLERPYRKDMPLEPIAAAQTEHPPQQAVTPPSAPLPPALSKPTPPQLDRQTYTYEQEPSLYAINEQDHPTFKLYEERLIATKHRQKTGDVIVSKHVETHTARIAVPLEKERVVIKRNPSGLQGQRVALEANAFQSGEVARFEVYEEVANIQKQPVVREEVRIRKELEQDMMQTEAQVRREALDIQTAGQPAVDAGIDPNSTPLPGR